MKRHMTKKKDVWLLKRYSLQKYQCTELWNINPDPIGVVNNIYHVLAQTPKHSISQNALVP